MDVAKKLQQAIATVEVLYYRLVLLVGPTGVGKTQELMRLGDELSTGVISSSSVLAGELLELDEKQRRLEVPKILAAIVNGVVGPCILDNLELLFDRGLGQDPLRLLQGISRNQTVIASWNGYVEGDRLVYARPGHPEYRTYPCSDIQFVMMEAE